MTEDGAGAVAGSVTAGWGGVAVRFAVGAVGLIGGGSEVVEFPVGSERETTGAAAAADGELVIKPLIWST